MKSTKIENLKSGLSATWAVICDFPHACADYVYFCCGFVLTGTVRERPAAQKRQAEEKAEAARKPTWKNTRNEDR